MKPLRYACGAGLGLLSPAALAARLEELQALVGYLPLLAFAAFAAAVALLVYSARLRDRRAAPLSRLRPAGAAIYSVGPDTLVRDCARMMTAERVGALLVMDGGRLAGIFTERDALNKVLAAGLDPGSTRVRDVMSANPCCVSPATSVGAAMALVTSGRFRHLPVVEDGRVLAVLSSGDLTHWLVAEKTGEVRELVDLASRS